MTAGRAADRDKATSTGGTLQTFSHTGTDLAWRQGMDRASLEEASHGSQWRTPHTEAEEWLSLPLH